MDDPLAIWGADGDPEASSEAPSVPEASPVASEAPKAPHSPRAAPAPSLLSPPAQPAPPARSDDDDEPGWGLAPSPPVAPADAPLSHPSKLEMPPPSPGLTLSDVPTPPAPTESILAPHEPPHPVSGVVETSTEGVAVEAAAPYYETGQSRPSSCNASRRASGHSTPTGFDKAELKLSTMTAPPTPDEHLPGNMPNPSGPLAVFSPAMSPLDAGGATRITGRPGSAHPALLHQHLSRLRQQNGDVDDKGKGKAVDAPIAPDFTSATSEANPGHAQNASADSKAAETSLLSGAPEPGSKPELKASTGPTEADNPPDADPVDAAAASANADAGFKPRNDDEGFDDFGEPGEFAEGDDDFGDFGDFGEVDAAPAIEPTPAPESASAEPTLKVPSYPLDADTESVLRALAGADLLSWLFSLPPPSGGESQDRIARLGRDGIRQMGGTAQVLGTHGGANALLDRMKNLPDLPPVVWDHSRTRAMHRQSLALPPDTPKPPPPMRHQSLSVAQQDLSRSTSPAPAPKRSNSGAPPQEKVSPNEPPAGLRLDRAAAKAVLSHSSDALHLLSLPALRGLVDSATTLANSASAELTHWLTVRDALAADAETYNTMIRDLVVGASARLGPGAPPPSARSGGKKSAMRFTMAAGIPRPNSPSTRSPTGSSPASRAGTPTLAGRSASGRQTPSGSR